MVWEGNRDGRNRGSSCFYSFLLFMMMVREFGFFGAGKGGEKERGRGE